MEMICELECSVMGINLTYYSMMRENPSRFLKCRLIIFYKMAGRKTAVSVTGWNIIFGAQEQFHKPQTTETLLPLDL